MSSLTRFTLCFIFTFFATVGSVALGETWTDSSGKFKIEAEFVGVEGRSVVLRRESGKKTVVPIARLSPESRAKAKAKYQEMMDALANPASDTNTPTPPLVRAKRDLSFSPPEPPAIAPIKSFPEDLSLQETVDFVKKQLVAGHPEVFWYALPAEVRDAIDSPEVRKGLNPFVEKHTATTTQIEAVIFKAIQVLVTKKEFVLGSAMMKQVPPPMVSSMQQGYDPVVGLIYELADASFAAESIGDNSISALIDYHAPRIGAHAKALLPLAPPGMVDEVFDSIVVEMTDEDNGILKRSTPPGNPTEEAADSGAFEISAGPQEDARMTRFKGRWVPSDLAENWGEIQKKLRGDLAAEIAAVEQRNAAQTQGAMMMVGAFTGIAGTILDSLLAADSQEAFDSALMQAQLMANMGGGTPGQAGSGAPELGPQNN